MLQHISQREKVKRGYKELMETNPDEVMTWGWDVRDNSLGGIHGGQIIVVGAVSGSGKSTRVNQVADANTSRGIEVVKYSLENRLEDDAKTEIFYMVNRIRAKEGRKQILRPKFVDNEYKDDEGVQADIITACSYMSARELTELDRDKNVTIDELLVLIEEQVEEKGARLFIVDHLHYFNLDGKDRPDLEIKDIMHKLNAIADKHNIAIILVAHYKTNVTFEAGMGKKPNMSQFSGGGAIFQVAHRIIQLVREEDDMERPVTVFYVTKYRGPVQNLFFVADFDLSTFEYSFRDTPGIGLYDGADPQSKPLRTSTSFYDALPEEDLF